MKVTVVIPNYNYGPFIAETLHSVLKQTYQDFEVIVIDDGSKDQSCQIVEDLKLQFKGRLRLIRQKNQGVAVARNTGITAAQGEFIAFLDADDIWLESTLATTMKFLQDNSNYGMVYGNTEFFESKTGKILGRNHGEGSPKIPYTGKCVEKLFVRGNFIPLMTVLIRKSIFTYVGLFDPQFRVGEDLDLWMRIAGKYEIGYIPQVLTRVRRHGRSLTFHALAHAKVNILRSKKCLRLYPELSKVVSKEIMDKKNYWGYYNLGMCLILDGKQKRGRKWLLKALRIDKNPFQNKIVMYYILSFVPGITLINQGRELLRKIRKQY